MERIRLCRVDDVERMVRGLRITIRMKARGPQTTGLCAGLVLAGMLTIVLLPETLPLENDLSLLAVLGIGIFVVLPAMAMVAQLIWSLYGRETLFLRGPLLCISRSIGPLSVRQTYSCLDRQERPDAPEQAAPPRQKPSFWELLCLERDRGCMGFCQGDRIIQVGRNLDKAETVYLITAIRILMQP